MYPRETKLENPELKGLIEEKGKLVNEGRGVSVEIEKLEAEMTETEEALIAEEKKVDLKEFHKKEKAITKRMEKCIKDIEEVKQGIYAKIKAETPQELRDKYDTLSKQKEEKEIERNKIALSAQKFNDKIIPLSRELMKPLLQDEYEDYDTIMIKDGEMVCAIFSHLDDFKTQFNTKKKN
jgi:fructose-specific phosphotransferase system component IIB